MAASTSAKKHVSLLFIYTVITLFIGSILLGLSFQTLQPSEMAIMYNQNVMKLDCENLYGAERSSESRRWFSGIGQGFYSYKFPMSVRQLTLADGGGSDGPSIYARTADGIKVSVSVSLQYKLPRDAARLCSIIYTYGSPDAMVPIFKSLVIDAVADAVSSFPTVDLWEDRPGLGLAMNRSVVTSIQSKGVEVTGFQFLSVDIPIQLQRAIENTTVVAQAIVQAALNKERALVGATTLKEQAVVSTRITSILAQAKANATLIAAEAEASALNLTITADARGYKQFQTEFPGMRNDQILALAWIDSVTSAKVGKIYVGADAPGVL